MIILGICLKYKCLNLWILHLINKKQLKNKQVKDTIKNSWKDIDFFDALEAAHKGETTEIDNFMSAYSLCSINKNYSLFLVIRPFKVQRWEEKRGILNTNPEPDDHEVQWGITILNYDATDGSGGSASAAIPNYDYKSIKIHDDDEIAIEHGNETTITNQVEIFSKLIGIYCQNASENEIEEKFKSLCNEIYTKPAPPEVVYETLESKQAGTLKFDSAFNWYTGKIKIEGKPIQISLILTHPYELKKNLKKMDKLLEKKFYENAIQKMTKPMVELKNDNWLGEDDDGKEEKPINKEKLLERIKMEAITFYEDCSAEIYFNDDDIFWGHSIVISTNSRGTFQDANIAG